MRRDILYEEGYIDSKSKSRKSPDLLQIPAPDSF